ncbi:MAG: heparan N-sulfatase, partial [Planctomycetota bacterium]
DQQKLTPAQADIFAAPRPPEALFDTATDYHQTKNLVNDPTYKETLEHMRSILDKWQNTTGDTVPKDLTPDRFDRKTGEKKFKGLNPPKRATIPGSEKNAQKINNPGPQ